MAPVLVVEKSVTDAGSIWESNLSRPQDPNPEK
jgi:hypothetical protein